MDARPYQYGDIVIASFRETYDREDHEALVVIAEDGKLLCWQLSTDEKGYFYTGEWRWVSASSVRATGKTCKVTDLFEHKSDEDEMLAEIRKEQIKKGNLTIKA